jgi:hypothetical protein
MNNLPLLSTFLLFLIRIVGEINFHSKLFPELINACALRPDNATDELPVDIELGRLE